MAKKLDMTYGKKEHTGIKSVPVSIPTLERATGGDDKVDGILQKYGVGESKGFQNRETEKDSGSVDGILKKYGVKSSEGIKEHSSSGTISQNVSDILKKYEVEEAAEPSFVGTAVPSGPPEPTSTDEPDYLSYSQPASNYAAGYQGSLSQSSTPYAAGLQAGFGKKPEKEKKTQTGTIPMEGPKDEFTGLSSEMPVMEPASYEGSLAPQGGIERKSSGEKRGTIQPSQNLPALQREEERENWEKFRQEPDFEALAGGAIDPKWVVTNYPGMTGDELKLYNYLIQRDLRDGTELNKKYGMWLSETLNQRAGAEDAKAIREIENPFARTLATGAYGVGAGLDRFARGFERSVFGDLAGDTTSAVQYGSQEVREDLAEAGPEVLGSSLGQIGYDLVSNTANMLPSIAAGTINPLLGAATMGVSAGGNAYDQAIREGYSEDQAKGYAVLTGASEAALQYVLGGISKLSSNVIGKTTLGKTVTAAIQNIRNATLRAAAQLGISSFSEAGEEYLQGILEPVYRNLTLGENNEFHLVSEEAAYDALLAILSTGVLEGPGILHRARQNKAQVGQQTDIAVAQQGGVSGVAPEVDIEQAQKTASTGETVKVGRATILKNPYVGEMPVQGVKTTQETLDISNELVVRSQTMIANAEQEAKLGRGAFKNLLTRSYEAIFKATKHVEVEGLDFQGRPYYVDINNGVPAKVISDVNHSPEKLALLEVLPSIVKNGEYVGSTVGKKKVTRYDHFETPVTIHGKPYLVLFETEVYPGANNYKTHRLIDIELVSQTDGDTGTPPAPSAETLTPVTKTVPQPELGVNTQYAPEDGDVHYSLKDTAQTYEGKDLSKDGSVYGYEFLTSLPDMTVTSLPEVGTIQGKDGRINARTVVNLGMENARKVGVEKDGKIYIPNSYTGRELRLDVSSIRHGLNGDFSRLLTNAKLGTVIGDVVKNAVPINALQNKADGVAGTYAMASYAVDGRGREFVAIITVEQRSGDVAGLEVYDVTHSLSGRQKRGERVDTKSQGVYPSTNASTISIADFLRVVKQTHQSILSEDVLAQFGEKRNPAGYYTGKAQFSLKDAETATQTATGEGEAGPTRPLTQADAKRFATETGTENGLVLDDYVQKRVRPETAERLNTLAKALGVRVRFVGSIRGGTANASIRGNEVQIERYNPNPVTFLLGHELTHRMQQLSPEAYARFKEAVRSEAEKEAQGLYTLYQNRGEKIDFEGAMDEATANYAGRLLEKGPVLDEFIQRHKTDRSLLEKLLDAVRDILSKLTGTERKQAETAEGKLLEALEETAEKVKKNGGETSTIKGGENPRFSLKEIQGLTESDVRGLLENTLNGQYADGSYIPLRKNTPGILISEVSKYTKGKTTVEDLPIVMNVGKARQAMEPDTGDSGVRQHSIDVDGMIEIVKNMDHPTYIVLQENGRYVEVVPFYGGGRGRKAWAVLDFGDFHYASHMNGYEGGSFHVLVTVFEPDDLKNYLKSHGNKIIYQKK